MSEHRHHWLVRLYPPSWRRRYGDEMDELLGLGCSWKDTLDIAKAASIERLLYSPTTGVQTMQAFAGGVGVLARKPSAIAPVIMSLSALLIVLVAIPVAGTKPQPDEGAAAHIWQLLMVGQLPILGWFVLHWVRRDFKAGVAVLGMQVAAIVAALLPVWLLGL
jgi:hypothetical protein